jgi:hypothetical protein
MTEVAKVCSRWLRCALGGYDVAKICPKYVLGAEGMPYVSLRMLRYD